MSTFTDRLGRKILERRKGKDNLCAETYFVYDISGDLRAVIQPRGVELLSTSAGKVDADILSNFAWTFTYDVDHRVIVSTGPGIEAQYYVYDRLGRLTMKQDARQRAADPPVWTVIKYDNAGRVAVEGTAQSDLGHNYWSAFCDTTELTESYTPNNEGQFFYTCNSGPKKFVPYMARFYDDYSFLEQTRLGLPGDSPIPQQPHYTGLPTGTMQIGRAHV